MTFQQIEKVLYLKIDFNMLLESEEADFTKLWGITSVVQTHGEKKEPTIFKFI